MTNFDEGALNIAEASPASEYLQQSDDFDESALQDDEFGDESLNDEFAEEGEQRGPIPYERFKQVNDELAQMRQWEPILDMVRESGFDSPETFMQAVHTQHQEAQTRSQLDPIAERLTAMVESGQYDWDTAETLWAAERDKVLANQDRAVYQNWHAGLQLEHARENFPEMDERYVVEMAQATGRPILQLAYESHSQRARYRDEAIARYNAAKGLAPAAPEGSGGPPPVPRGAPDPERNPQGFIAWMDRQAQETQARYGR